MKIDDKIHHLQTLRTAWEIEVNHSLNPTDKEIAQDIVDSLDAAMRLMDMWNKLISAYEKEVDAIEFEDDRKNATKRIDDLIINTVRSALSSYYGEKITESQRKIIID